MPPARAVEWTWGTATSANQVRHGEKRVGRPFGPSLFDRMIHFGGLASVLKAEHGWSVERTTGMAT